MRRLAPVLVVAILLLTSVAPAWAASLNFTGYIDAEIKYTPEDKWTGRTGIEITAGMSATNKYSLRLGFFDQDKLFWETYSQWTFRPSDISLYAQGRLWENGPIVKGTLGDFAMLGPVYMAGDRDKAAVRGAMVENLPAGPAKLSAYWAWPRNSIAPLSSDSASKVYGGQINIGNLRGIRLDLYGALRQGQYDSSGTEQQPLSPANRTWIAPDGISFTFAHVDEPFSTTPNPNGLWLYSRHFSGSTSISQWSDAVYIRQDGSIVRYQRVNTYGSLGGRPIPPGPGSDYDYLIVGWSGAEKPHLWMRDHIEAPYSANPQVKFTASSGYVDHHTYAQAVAALESSFHVAGLAVSGKLGSLVTSDRYRHTTGDTAVDVESEVTQANFCLVSASTAIPIGAELATKPLTLTVEYRGISPDFTPWARSTDPDTNRIERQRGQQGVNLQMATTLLPANPVDFKVTLDSYRKGDDRVASSMVEMGTVLAGYEVSGKLGTDGTELGIARNLSLGLPEITKARPSYRLVLGNDSSTKHVVSLSTEFSLGGFRRITANGSYEITSTPGGEGGEGSSSAVTSLSASYTAPNGWTLKGGWRGPDQTDKRDDTYVSLYYKVTI